jgi:hypothetical protein
MACEYYSRTEIGTFTNLKALEKALARVKAEGFNSYRVNGLTVEINTGSNYANSRHMDALKQAYSTEAAKAALKAKGYAVAEKKDRNTGKIRLTVQA